MRAHDLTNTDAEQIETEHDGLGHELTPEEGCALLDRNARYYLGMSGVEFARAWDAGEFDGKPETPGLVRTAMLLPLVRE